MQPRIKNPAMLIPDALGPLQTLAKVLSQGDVPEKTLELVHLRASQINGCGVCLHLHLGLARKSGETDERLMTLAGWRDAPFFTDAERAALALTEAVTRLADRGDVPDDVWRECTRHYNDKQLAVLTLYIGLTNLFNRANVTTRQLAGSYKL